MRNPQTLEDVTPAMRKAILRIAERQIRCNDPERGGIHPLTFNALKRRALIDVGHDKFRREVWKLTDKAWMLVTAHTPRLLTPSARPHGTEHGYTTEPHSAMWDEPEAVDQATQEAFSKQAREKPRTTAAEVIAEEKANIEAALRRLRAAELGRPKTRVVASLKAKLAKL